MRGRYHQEFLGKDYQKLVVKPGICNLLKRPYRGLQTTLNFSSDGVRTATKEKGNEGVAETLSKGESKWRLQLLSDPAVEHIACQHALDPRDTMRCAMKIGEEHPSIRGKFTIMTTDAVATVRTSASPGFRAYSYKRECDLVERVKEKLLIEAAYWRWRGVPFELILDTDLNMTVVSNMELIVGRRDPTKLPCDEATKCDALAFMTVHIRARSAAFGEICNRCDRELGLPPGTAIAVGYHAIVQRMWPVDLHQPILRSRPLSLI
jgi:hypothetical protein